MSLESKKSLVSFMKSHLGDKAKKNHDSNLANNLINHHAEKKEENKKNDKSKTKEDIEKEELQKAKNESNAKAANINKLEMFKKLFFQSGLRYIFITAFMVIMLIFLIKFGIEIMKFLNGIIYKILIKSLATK